MTTSGAWSTPSNWGGTIPANDGTADLIFSMGGSLSSRGDTVMDLDWNVRSISWSATAADQNGLAFIEEPGVTNRVLTLQQGITNATARLTIYPDLVLGAFQTWQDNGTTGLDRGIVVSGVVSGGGGIQKTGSGKVSLSALTNTYSGGTRVNAGVLEVTAGNSLGTGSVELDGGTLRFARFGGVSFTTALGALSVGAGGGTIEVQSATLMLSGPISGAGALRLAKDPSAISYYPNRFVMSGENSHAGGTTIDAVTVNVPGTARSLGTGGVTLQAGAVLGLNAEANLGTGSRVMLAPQTVLVLNDAAIDPRNVVAGAGTSGGIVALGTVNYSTPLDFAQIGNGQLYLGAGGTGVYSAATLGPNSDGNQRLGGGSVDQTMTPTLTLSGHDQVLTGPRTVIVGDTFSALSDVRSGTTVVLSEHNDYSGGTLLQSGTLLGGKDDSFGSGRIDWFGGALGFVDGMHTLGNPVRFTNPTPSSSHYLGGNSDFTFAGPVDLGGSTRILSGLGNNPNQRAAFTGPISNGGLQLTSGRFALLGDQPFAGGFTLAQGELEIDRDRSLGAAGQTARLSGLLKTLDSFTISRPLEVGTLYLDTAGHDLTISGRIDKVPGGNPGFLRKQGAGTLRLTNAIADVGELQVMGGTVELANSANSLGGVRIFDGGVLTGVGGANAVGVETGGRLQPCGNAAGTFEVEITLTLNAGAILEFDLGMVAADRIVFTGVNPSLPSLTGTSAVVNINDAGGLAPGQRYTLIDWTAGGAATMSAANFQLGSSPVDGQFEMVGRTLQFVTVPEPSAAVLAVAGLCCVLSRRRR